MKFVHIADMHFDSSLSSLSEIEGLTEKIRLEQREIFRKIINYIKENKIELLFIAGDLYEQKYIRETTIEYINNLFKEIENTKIFITPGNHDPFLKNSYYNNFNWNNNVYIFNNENGLSKCISAICKNLIFSPLFYFFLFFAILFEFIYFHFLLANF